MGAFSSCNNLSCVAILNEDCNISSSAFEYTNYSENYNSLRNSSSYCIDNTVYYNCIAL